MATIRLHDIVTKASASIDTSAKALTNLTVVSGALYLELAAIDYVAPASLVLHGVAVAANYYLARGVSKVYDAAEAAHERREQERFERDLLRYVEPPTHGYIKRDRAITAVAAVALAGLLAGAAWTIGKWFFSGRPIPAEKGERTSPSSSDGEDREDGEARELPSSEVDRELLSRESVLPDDECIQHGRTRYSLGCFDLREGLAYPADPRSAAFNRIHDGGGKAQDIACLANGIHGAEGSPVYAPISGRIAKVDRVNDWDPTCERDDLSERCHDKGGLSIVIENDDLRVYLAHGIAIPDYVVPDIYVNTGQTVMYCGATGNATHTTEGRVSSVPHTHFAVQRRERGEWVGVNPFEGAEERHGQTEPARLPTKRYDSPAQGGSERASLASYLRSRGRP